MSLDLSTVEPRRSVSTKDPPFRLAAVDNTDEVGVPGEDLKQINIKELKTVPCFKLGKYVR